MAQAVSRRPLTAKPRVRSRSVHVAFMVDKVTLWQVPPPPPVLRFSPVNFLPPVLHYKEKRTKKTNDLHHRVAQWASRLRCVRSICGGALHLPPPPPQTQNEVFVEIYALKRVCINDTNFEVKIFGIGPNASGGWRYKIQRIRPLQTSST
jgi:hypothetical protein